MWCNLHGRVSSGRGGTTNEQWALHSLLLHLLGHVNHLVQRGSDQTGETNDIGVDSLGLGNNLVGWKVGHDTEINNLKDRAEKQNEWVK